MDEKTFLIAGGGIAGIAAALGLAKVGIPSRVFEQHPAFAEVGAGIQMSPNGVSALKWLGAWEAIEHQCVIPTEIHVRNGLSGGLLQRVRLGKPFEQRFGAPYRVAHRSDLLAGLVTSAQSSDFIELNTDRQVTGAITTENGAQLHFAGESREMGRAVIAADGIRSNLRQDNWPGTEPRHRGLVMYRALIPFDDVPPEIAPDCVTLWLYPGGHVVHYPVSNWRQFNIVAAFDSPWSGTNWMSMGDLADVKQAFACASPGLAAMVATPKEWLRWAGADLVPLESWSHGNVMLIGDAAHAMLPFLAQGAVMSLEDACVLAQSVAGGQGFGRYEELRRPRTRRIQRESLRLAAIYHAKGLKALARNAALRLMGGEQLLNRLSWIYEWNVPDGPPA